MVIYQGYCVDQRNARSLFFDITRYVTMNNEKWYTSRAPFDTWEEISAFDIPNHVNYMYM